jgi:hypothetical protein
VPQKPARHDREGHSELEALNERMSCRPAAADEGTFAATILAFTDEEASDAARELTSINHQIETELQDARGNR